MRHAGFRVVWQSSSFWDRGGRFLSRNPVLSNTAACLPYFELIKFPKPDLKTKIADGTTSPGVGAAGRDAQKAKMGNVDRFEARRGVERVF